MEKNKLSKGGDNTAKVKAANAKAKSGDGKKRVVKPPHIIIGVLVLALAGVLVFFLWQREEAEPPPRGTVQGGTGIVLTPDNIDEVDSLLAGPGRFGQFRVGMTSEWVFDNGQAPSSTALVRNHPSNPSTVFFDVVLNDTDEVVYSSPYIPLGEEISNFALDVNLSAGVYEAMVIYFLVDDDYEVVTTASFGVTLMVMN